MEIMFIDHLKYTFIQSKSINYHLEAKSLQKIEISHKIEHTLKL